MGGGGVRRKMRKEARVFFGLVTIEVDEVWSASSREVVMGELIVVEVRRVARGAAMRAGMCFDEVVVGFAAWGVAQRVENHRARSGDAGAG